MGVYVRSVLARRRSEIRIRISIQFVGLVGSMKEGEGDGLRKDEMIFSAYDMRVSLPLEEGNEVTGAGI